MWGHRKHAEAAPVGAVLGRGGPRGAAGGREARGRACPLCRRDSQFTCAVHLALCSLPVGTKRRVLGEVRWGPIGLRSDLHRSVGGPRWSGPSVCAGGAAGGRRVLRWLSPSSGGSTGQCARPKALPHEPVGPTRYRQGTWQTPPDPPGNRPMRQKSKFRLHLLVVTAPKGT